MRRHSSFLTIAAAGFFALLLSHGPATASAWNRPAGVGFLSFDYTLDSGTEYFDGRGHLAPARAYTKSELAAYVEYGATDSLTLIARPSLDDVSVGAPDAGHHRGLGDGAAGAQWQALTFGPAVLAVQGTFSLPGSTSRSDPAVVGDTAREGDLRMLAGASLPFPFRPFFDLQGSYRLRSGGAADQWHADATLGLYPTDRLLVLLQSFTTVPTGPGDARNPSSRYTRIEASGVYALTPSWEVKFGASTTVAGRNALRGRGFTTGVWRLF